MRNKILTVLAAGALLAACECGPEQQEVNVGSSVAPAAPGTAEDFKQNIKDRVFFDFNKSKLSADSIHTLEAQSGWLKTYANTTATIEGHCDSRGTREYNLALGERRAHSVSKELAHLGIDASRLKTISYGKEKPLMPNAMTEQDHASNRVAVTNIN